MALSKRIIPCLDVTGGRVVKGVKFVGLRDAGGRLTTIAVVEPSVDFGRLEQVFVMLRRGPIMDVLYRPNRPETDLTGPARVALPPIDHASTATPSPVSSPLSSKRGGP